MLHKLFDKLVSSIDNCNACSSIRAENFEDISTSLNPWCQAFLDAFDPQTRYAQNFKAPEAKQGKGVKL
jgi:hypothetical protein